MIKKNEESTKINPSAPICISAKITNLPNKVYCVATVTVDSPATQTDAVETNNEFKNYVERHLQWVSLKVLPRIKINNKKLKIVTSVVLATFFIR
jgi:hypothetical protein